MADLYKVLVVDDASFMRKAVADILTSDPEIEVVGTAKNGLDGLEQIRRLEPDVITLDVDMPIMDGITAIRHIMIRCPVPIVVLSSLYANGAITFEALRLGVVDFIPKPSGAISEDIHAAGQAIISRLKIATAVNMNNVRRVRVHPGHRPELRLKPSRQPLEYLVAIGTSLGGPNTFLRMLTQLDIDLPAAVVVALEIDDKIVESFAETFARHVAWEVRPARDGDVIEQGICYIHSNRFALDIDVNVSGEPCLRVSETSGYPLDRLFASAATVFGNHAVGTLLTGVGQDGAEGFRAIRERGGVTLAQNSTTCVYPNLTDHAIRNRVVDRVVDEVFLPREIEAVVRG